MTFPNLDGRPPDRTIAPAYRLAPDTPAEIAADLARLCAPAGQDVPAMGIPMTAEPARTSEIVSDSSVPLADTAEVLA